MTNKDGEVFVPAPSTLRIATRKDSIRLDEIYSRELDVLQESVQHLLDLGEVLSTQKGREDELSALIVQMREANEQLVLATLRAQEQHALAEMARVRQAEILSRLVYELRAPLEPVMLAGSLLRKIDALHPDIALARGVIERQVGHMARLADELSDASQAVTGNAA